MWRRAKKRSLWREPGNRRGSGGARATHNNGWCSGDLGSQMSMTGHWSRGVSVCSAQPAPNVEEATLPAGAAPTATPNPAAEMAPDPPRSRAVLAPRGGGEAWWESEWGRRRRPRGSGAPPTQAKGGGGGRPDPDLGLERGMPGGRESEVWRRRLLAPGMHCKGSGRGR
jgi:hypothetical protein